jgi:hypothetical protein
MDKCHTDGLAQEAAPGAHRIPFRSTASKNPVPVVGQTLPGPTFSKWTGTGQSFLMFLVISRVSTLGDEQPPPTDWGPTGGGCSHPSTLIHHLLLSPWIRRPTLAGICRTPGR